MLDKPSVNSEQCQHLAGNPRYTKYIDIKNIILYKKKLQYLIRISLIYTG